MKKEISGCSKTFHLHKYTPNQLNIPSLQDILTISYCSVPFQHIVHIRGAAAGSKKISFIISPKKQISNVFLQKQKAQWNLHVRSSQWKSTMGNIRKWVKETNIIGLVHCKLNHA